MVSSQVGVVSSPLELVSQMEVDSSQEFELEVVRCELVSVGAVVEPGKVLSG